MTAHPDNRAFATVMSIARPKQKYTVSLFDWLAAPVSKREAMDVWCRENNYELVIDAQRVDGPRRQSFGTDELIEREDRAQDYERGSFNE